MVDTKKIAMVKDIIPRRKLDVEQLDTLKAVTETKIDALIDNIASKDIGTIEVGRVPMKISELDTTEKRILADDIEMVAGNDSVAKNIMITRMDEIIASVMNAKETLDGTNGNFRGSKAKGTEIGWVLPWISPRLFALAEGAPAANVGYSIAYATANTWQSSFATAANKTMGTYSTATLLMVGSLTPSLGLAVGLQPMTDTVQFIVDNSTYEEVNLSSMLFGSGKFGTAGTAGAGMVIGGDNRNRVPITPIPTVTLPPRATWRMYSRGLGVGTDWLQLGGVFLAPANEISGQAATAPTGAA